MLGWGTAIPAVSQHGVAITGTLAAGLARRWKASDIRPPQRWGINE